MFNFIKKYISENTGILIRLDDIAENMNWPLMEKCELLFDKYNIKPLLGVVSNNQDPELLSYKKNHNFEADTILASVKNNQNIEKLINLIKVKLSKKYSSNNSVLITRERHRIKLNQCLEEIDKFLQKNQNTDLELAAEDLRMATRHLGSIVGKVDVEEVLGSIFKDFCIGK